MFKYHKEVDYAIDGEIHRMTNLTKSNLILNRDKTLLQSIRVDSRTPEQIAHEIYGDAKLFWTILFVNNIIDPFTEWYMPVDQLYDFCKDKYGEDKMYDVIYFMDRSNKQVITGDDADRFFDMINNNQILPENIDGVTYFEHEQTINENRNVISIIPKANISKFVEMYKKVLK